MQDLHAGDAGPFVTFAQTRLLATGFGPVTLTGALDPQTMARIVALQRAWGLPQTGEVDGDTWRALLSALPQPSSAQGPSQGPVFFSDDDEEELLEGDEPEFTRLSVGASGRRITELQLRLRAAGHECPIEQPLGEGTLEAISAFQVAEGIPAEPGLSYEGWLTLLSATADAHLLDWFDASDVADAGGPVFFGGEYRDVPGSGGYAYRQYDDGAIEIRVDPSGRVTGRTLTSGRAWQAITAEIGAYPDEEPDTGRSLVKEGSRGDDARALQRRLNALGFGPLAEDGVFGAGSLAALRRFQAAAGLDVDGQAGPNTWDKLADPWPTLQQGSKGAEVLAVQQKLVALGQPIQPDGDYGPNTAAAVRSFQQAEGLPATGVVDAATRGHILGATEARVPVDLLEAERARLRALVEQQVQGLPSGARGRIRAVLLKAVESVGIRESHGPNRGPELDIITAGFSDPSAPWCALAVSWWVKEGLGASSWSEVPWGRQNASSMWFGQWGESQGRVIDARQAAPVGAIMVMERAGSGSDAATGGRGGGARFAFRPGHTSLVIQDLGDRVMTIDGNVSDTCKACTRSKSSLLGYVTWW